MGKVKSSQVELGTSSIVKYANLSFMENKSKITKNMIGMI